MRLFKPQMTSAEFNAALREAGFGAAESWMCPASAPASPPSMVTAWSTVAPRSRGLSETRPIRARQLGTHQRPSYALRSIERRRHLAASAPWPSYGRCRRWQVLGAAAGTFVRASLSASALSPSIRGIWAALAKGDAGMHKIAARFGVGTGTVQRIRAEMVAA
jgi:hypothetical protein